VDRGFGPLQLLRKPGPLVGKDLDPPADLGNLKCLFEVQVE